MNFDLGNLATSVGIGGGLGFLVGYAVKKIFKIILVLAGLSIATLSYLQLQGIVAVNWDKLDSAARGTLTGFNATSQLPAVAPALGEQILTAMSNSGIPLTGGLAAGFAFGFSRG
jgi:uncharacterized membrane protein (Fun14 family)